MGQFVSKLGDDRCRMGCQTKYTHTRVSSVERDEENMVRPTEWDTSERSGVNLHSRTTTMTMTMYVVEGPCDTQMHVNAS